MKYLLALVATLVLITCNELTNPEDYEVYYGEEIPNTRILWSPRIAFSPLYANPKVSPDGNYIIYSNKIESGGSISSFYITNLSEIYPQRFSMERIGGPSWSPDSKSIIYQMDWDLYKKNIYTNEIQRITKTEQGNYYRFGMFSSDGESILYIYYNENDGIHGLGIIENDNVNTKLFEGRFGNCNWFSNGVEILYLQSFSSHKGTEFRKLNITDGESSRLWALENYSIKNVTLSPDDKYVLFTGMNENGKSGIWLMSIAYGKPMLLLDEDRINFKIGRPSWYPNSKDFIYERYRITSYENTTDVNYTIGNHSFYKMNILSALSYVY